MIINAERRLKCHAKEKIYSDLKVQSLSYIIKM